MTSLTRRALLQASALAATTAALPAHAAAPLATTQAPGVYRYRLGDYQLTALYDGVWQSPIGDDFIRNADAAAVDDALAAAFLPPRVLPISFTALLVNTGAKLVLIDTGTGGQTADSAGALPDALRAAGIAPAAIDTIVISHFHPDHIDGLRSKTGERIFTNAEILVPEPEWAFWMDDGNQSRATGTVFRYFRNARRIFGDLGSAVGRFTPGDEVAPGIVSIPAYGHTPGHCAFAIHSTGRSMLVMSDTVRNPYLFARYPRWQPIFDMDGAQAVASRLTLLERAAADRMLVAAYHFPFPACGHIARRGDGYELVPAEWRPL